MQPFHAAGADDFNILGEINEYHDVIHFTATIDAADFEFTFCVAQPAKSKYRRNISERYSSHHTI